MTCYVEAGISDRRAIAEVMGTGDLRNPLHKATFLQMLPSVIRWASHSILLKKPKAMKNSPSSCHTKGPLVDLETSLETSLWRGGGIVLSYSISDLFHDLWYALWLCGFKFVICCSFSVVNSVGFKTAVSKEQRTRYVMSCLINKQCNLNKNRKLWGQRKVTEYYQVKLLKERCN